VGGCGGPTEILLPTRTAHQRGEMDEDQDADGRFQMESPAIWSAMLPLLDGTTGPSCGEDIAPPGSSPDLVCGRHSHFGRQSERRFNEPRDSSSYMQRSRIDRQQKEILIISEPTAELPLPADQSEDQDDGTAA